MSILIPNKYGIVIREWHETGLRLIPDTRPRQDYANEGIGKGDPIRIFNLVWQHIDEINSDPKSREWARSVGNMWINLSYEPGQTPRAEAITCGGNFVKILGYSLKHYKVASYRHIRPLIPSSQNWFTRPDLHFKANAIDRNLNVFNVANGLDVYLPFLNTTGESWLPEEAVEVFPEIPLGGLKVTELESNKVLNILDYRVEGASVLGRMLFKWVYLLKSTKPGERIFPTTWSLNTEGVIPPPV
jgi:hypothetical protein